MELVVRPGTAPTRLDRFLTAHVGTVSRRRLREHPGGLRVNARPARRSTIVRPGDRITVPDELLHPPEVRLSPDAGVSVLFEDTDIIAVDKPAGLSSLGHPRGEARTVAGFLIARDPALRSAGRSPLEGGLVHRLDRDTSGVLLAARTPRAYVDLRAQFAAHAVDKEYLALVAGDVAASGCISTPIAHDPRRPARMRACGSLAQQASLKARPAETAYRPEVRWGIATLLRVSIRSGVRHQVRVHLASIGHSVIGDATYGAQLAPPRRLGRHALHACRIRLRHPATDRILTVDSPLPRDLEHLMRDLSRRAPAGTAGGPPAGGSPIRRRRSVT